MWLLSEEEQVMYEGSNPFGLEAFYHQAPVTLLLCRLQYTMYLEVVSWSNAHYHRGSCSVQMMCVLS